MLDKEPVSESCRCSERTVPQSREVEGKPNGKTIFNDRIGKYVDNHSPRVFSIEGDQIHKRKVERFILLIL